VAASPGVLRGYVRGEQAGEVELRVRIPRGARRVRTWVNGRATRHRVREGYAVFRANVAGDAAVDWAMTSGATKAR
jgi:DUF1680 family protein